MYLCLLQNRRWDDLVWTKGLSWINKGGEDLAALFAFGLGGRDMLVW